jgi:hypothetical protein
VIDAGANAKRLKDCACHSPHNPSAISLRDVSGWKLTVRNGPEVSHEQFDDLDEAVAALRARALALRSQPAPKTAALLRTFKPEDQVQARLQLSGGGLLRKQAAGIDVHGDGEFVPFRGGISREEIEPGRDQTPFDAVRETLRQR